MTIKDNSRKANEEDLEKIYSFFSSCILNYFPYYSEKSKNYILNKKYTKEVIERAVMDGFAELCLDKNRIVGALIITSEPSAGLWDLNWIIVDENYRGLGIGTSLLKLWENEALLKGVHCLTTQTSNEDEIGFYKNRGFVYFGSIPQGTYGNTKHKFYKIIQEPKEENYLRF